MKIFARKVQTIQSDIRMTTLKPLPNGHAEVFRGGRQLTTYARKLQYNYDLHGDLSGQITLVMKGKGRGSENSLTVHLYDGTPGFVSVSHGAQESRHGVFAHFIAALQKNIGMPGTRQLFDSELLTAAQAAQTRGARYDRILTSAAMHHRKNRHCTVDMRAMAVTVKVD